MRSSRPPALAIKVVGAAGFWSFRRDLIEQYRQGRSASWVASWVMEASTGRRLFERFKRCQKPQTIRHRFGNRWNCDLSPKLVSRKVVGFLASHGWLRMKSMLRMQTFSVSNVGIPDL